ncbi:proteophosphoglycan ppg4 [Rhizoctonia solani AG-1 IB]|uniref:Proteophosphoglycan ppg4 n=2 Tax=Thanatephorus cucumeris (strain AG1-IB / isolate 7/3/14) TaxID=1108050 RepID=A0A0B7FBE0_THACB|nr:proteophosphoglycan ppg4 [Rhizoctonia solani AG-1 IB]
MSTLPVRGNRANKPHNRKPYDKAPVSSPSPPPQLARSKSTFFNAVKAVFAGWFSGGDSANGDSDRDRDDKHLKRRSSRSKLDNGARPKRIRTVSPQRIPTRKSGYLDPPEHMIRPAGSLGRSSKLTVTSDSEQTHSSVRNTPLGFGTYRAPRSPPSRRTPSISSWFPPPASTRNSLGPKASQVHFGTLPSNLDIDAAISSYDDTRMQSRSPSVGVGVGLGRERTPSRAIPRREASISLPLAPRTSLSKATGNTIRASLAVSNPFSGLGKSSSLAPERRKPTLVWDDKVGVTKAGKPRAPTAPPAKNTAERLLNALENMHTLTGDAQRPRRRPPPYVQVPTPGLGDRRSRMIQPYGEIKIAPNKPKKSGDNNSKSGLMKMLMKNKKEVQEEDMEMEEEAAQRTQSKEAPPAEPASEKSKAKDADTDMDSDSAPAPKTATSSPLKVVDNFKPASQPPSRPGSSLRQSKTITKRAHAHSAGRNRFSANNEEEDEDEDALEKRNAELLAVAHSNVFKVPEGFTFGVSSAAAAPKPVEPSKALEVVSPQPIPAKPATSSVLSFSPPAAPAKEAASVSTTFFGGKDTPKVAVPEVKNPFANVGATKPDIKVPDVPKWGSTPSSSAPTPPPKPIEGASPFANIGVSAKPIESAPAISFGKPAEKSGNGNPFENIGKAAVLDNPFGKVDKPKSSSDTGKSIGDNPFANIGKPVGGNPFGGGSKPAGDNPFAGIGTGDKSVSPAPVSSFSFGAKSEGTSASTTPAPAAAPAIPSFFTKPTEAPKPVEPPKPAIEPTSEAPKPTSELPKPSPFSFSASKPADKPAAPPFSFGAPTPALGSTSAAAPATTTPSPFSFGASSGAPVPTPAAPAPTAKPAFAFGLPASTPSPAPSLTEAPKKNPFEFSAPAAAPASTEAPKKSPFEFSAPSAPAQPAPTTSKSPFDFSSTTKPAEQPASSFVFGSTPKPGPAAAPAAAEKKNPFDFSGSTQKPASSTPFVFGASNTSAPVSTGFAFGAAPAPARPSTPPSGGDAAMEESPTRDPAPSKIVTSGFGNTAGSGFGSQTTSTGFAFGSATNGTTSTPFGGASGATTTGPFGGPLSGANSNQSNGLGSTTSNSSPFAFGASNNAGSGFGSTTSNGFGTNASAATSSTPFAFGAGGGFGQTPSATSSPSNPFSQPNTASFGQPNPTPTNAFPTPASPFPAASPALSTVGFNTNSSAPANNAFGSNQSGTNGFPGSPATPAFAFGASNPAVGAASPSTFTFGLPGGASAPATPTSTSSPFVFGQGATPSVPEGSPAPGVQFNLGTADASPGGRKIKPLRRPRRN